MIFDFGKINGNKKNLRNIIIALGALILTGCGAVPTSEDINTTLDSIKTAVDEGDNDFIESKINQLKEQAKDIRKQAEKDGNYEEQYKAECIEELCLSYEDLFEAQEALNDIKEMEKVGILDMVKDVNTELSNPETAPAVSDIRIKQKEEYAEEAFKAYCICKGNINLAKAGLASTKTAKINLPSFDVATQEGTVMLATIEANIDAYSDFISQTFRLSKEKMEALNTLQAEHGIDSKEFRENLLTGGKKEKGKDKWSLQEKVDAFINKLKTKTNKLKDTTVDNAKLLAEQARIGAELRAKQAEMQGWKTRIKTGGPKEKVEAKEMADQLEDEIEKLQKRFDAISSAEDYTAYIKWLEENGYEVPEDEKEPSNEGIGEEVVEMSEEEWLEENGYGENEYEANENKEKGDGELPEIEVGN